MNPHQSLDMRAVSHVLSSIGAKPLRRLAAAGMAGAAAELAAVALMATATWLIVRAAAQPPIAVLGLAIVGVRAFALSRPAFRYFERLAGHDAALSALATLRQRTYGALERLGPTGLGGLRGSDTLSRVVSDVDAVQDLLLRCLLPAAVAVVSATAAVTLCSSLLPTAGLLSAGGLLLAILLVPAATHLVTRRFVARDARARAELAGRSLDLVDGAAELAAYGAAATALANADAAARRLARLQRATAQVESVAGGVILALQSATTLGVVFLAEDATRHGLPPILVPVLALTCFTVFESTVPLPAAARHLISATTATHRLAELFDAPAGLTEPADPRPLGTGPVTVTLRDVRVRYAADRPPALDGIDLHVEPGKRVALVGPSGSGKSTMLAVLARMVRLEEGTFTVNGHDARTLAADEVRSHLTGATQDSYIFHASLRDNLALARPEATDAQLADAARRARLSDWIDSLPGGLDTVVTHDGASMSGGQRRRLVLARALLAEPDVLLLDEPVEGLDPLTAEAVLSETLAATEGKATVLVTHRLAGLDTVDEIIVLDEGRIAQRGRHLDLVTTPGPYRELWRIEQLVTSADDHGRSAVVT